jgi:outer membrane protein assembly factor BamB
MEQAPAAAPTLEPVLPPLPSATPLAAAPAPGATATPVPLAQGESPSPIASAPGAPPAGACPTGAARLPGRRYGVNIVPGDVPLDRSLDLARDMNAGWVRATLLWSDLEPQPGAFRWDTLDALTAGTQSRGLRLLLAVAQSPVWAGERGGLPAKPEDFGAFMGALAGRASGKIGAYEIWPSPNTAAANGGTIAKPTQYAAILQAGYDAVKQADPCALVLNGALSPSPPNNPAAMDDLAFLRGMFAYQKEADRSIYDILAVQLNTSGMPGKGKWPRDNMAKSRGFYGHVNVVRDEMTAANAADKQVWVVRVGYSVEGDLAVSPEKQAEYTTELLDFARWSNPYISAIFARDLGAAEPGFSLLNPDGSPRPVFKALRDYFGEARKDQEQTAQIDGTDLTLLWKLWPNPEPVGQLVPGPDGAIYTETGNGYVRVIDPNGALRLVVKPSRKRVPGVAVDGQGRIFGSGNHGVLSAYTPGGDLLWTVEADGTPTTQMLISADGQALLSGTDKQRLDAYAADDGHKLWGTPLGGDSGAPAIGGDGTIYLGSSDGALHAIAPDGTPRWRYQSAGFPAAAPLVGKDAIYGATDAGVLFALDMSGAQRWRVELHAPAIGLSAGADGTLYATTADGALHAIAPDGAARWATPLGGGLPTAPAAAPDGLVYVGAEDGRLRVVAPGGKVAGVYDAGTPLRVAPLIGRDGAVYLAAGKNRDAVLAFGTQALKERYNAP